MDSRAKKTGNVVFYVIAEKIYTLKKPQEKSCGFLWSC